MAAELLEIEKDHSKYVEIKEEIPEDFELKLTKDSPPNKKPKINVISSSDIEPSSSSSASSSATFPSNAAPSQAPPSFSRAQSSTSPSPSPFPSPSSTAPNFDGLDEMFEELLFKEKEAQKKGRNWDEEIDEEEGEAEMVVDGEGRGGEEDVVEIQEPVDISAGAIASSKFSTPEFSYNSQIKPNTTSSSSSSSSISSNFSSKNSSPSSPSPSPSSSSSSSSTSSTSSVQIRPKTTQIKENNDSQIVDVVQKFQGLEVSTPPTQIAQPAQQNSAPKVSLFKAQRMQQKQ